MTTKAKELVDNIKTAQIQSHAYPSRQEIIAKCESGSFHPILKNKGRGGSLGDYKESRRKFRSNWDQAFGRVG